MFLDGWIDACMDAHSNQKLVVKKVHSSVTSYKVNRKAIFATAILSKTCLRQVLLLW
jgi:hypothetical protein